MSRFCVGYLHVSVPSPSPAGIRGSNLDSHGGPASRDVQFAVKNEWEEGVPCLVNVIRPHRFTSTRLSRQCVDAWPFGSFYGSEVYTRSQRGRQGNTEHNATRQASEVTGMVSCRSMRLCGRCWPAETIPAHDGGMDRRISQRCKRKSTDTYPRPLCVWNQPVGKCRSGMAHAPLPPCKV